MRRDFILRVLILSVALYVVGKYSSLIYIDNWLTALLGAIVLALVNAVVRPLIVILTLPVTCLTMGIFIFVVNGITLCLAGVFVPGFVTHGLFRAVIASILISIISSLLHFITKKN